MVSKDDMNKEFEKWHAERSLRLAKFLAEKFRQTGFGASDLSEDGDFTEFVVYGAFNLAELAAAAEREITDGDMFAFMSSGSTWQSAKMHDIWTYRPDGDEYVYMFMTREPNTREPEAYAVYRKKDGDPEWGLYSEAPMLSQPQKD